MICYYFDQTEQENILFKHKKKPVIASFFYSSNILTSSTSFVYCFLHISADGKWMCYSLRFFFFPFCFFLSTSPDNDRCHTIIPFSDRSCALLLLLVGEHTTIEKPTTTMMMMIDRYWREAMLFFCSYYY
jgi:hypothetical protein